jgi:transcriptional regulator with XRE-family HTH domain
MKTKVNSPRGRSLVNTAEIARRLGISQSYVAKIMNGSRKSKRYKDKIEQLLKSEFGKPSTRNKAA